VYRVTHVVIGFGYGLLLGDDLVSSIFYGLISGFSSYIPDLDLRYKHRKTLHNIFVLTIISLLLYTGLIFLNKDYHLMNNYMVFRIVLAFSGGWFLHLVVDSFTKMGVYWFYPLSNIRVRIPLFRSNSLIGNVFFIMLSFIMYYYWMNRIGLGNILYLLINYVKIFLLSGRIIFS
jgi:inner membrane protein